MLPLSATCSNTADGFGGGWGRVQILRIMRDSRIGTYALVGVALLLQIKVQALVAMQGERTGVGGR